MYLNKQSIFDKRSSQISDQKRTGEEAIDAEGGHRESARVGAALAHEMSQNAEAGRHRERV